MNIIFYLIIISLVVAISFLAAFIWAIRSGQYDDDYTPSMRILVEDDMIDTNIEKQTNTNDVKN
ncbi:MAG TPA: cbb3-type cytochrome oxidase assembly protein CcoS [Saprospiraceae bacterium]|nr:cbb3-type cytochrome oxidase assembly protein CcoS [Saprospiraceae bacterium]MCB9329139.1 cbb3-type cytochrome oxidase assembly protein CcoS [Lewinellaceae bacterium]HPQ22027.1 cbb3-type cytochrome oxidase assembly protein CcoS [Saprospiraceae bacterium]